MSTAAAPVPASTPAPKPSISADATETRISGAGCEGDDSEGKKISSSKETEATSAKTSEAALPEGHMVESKMKPAENEAEATSSAAALVDDNHGVESKDGDEEAADPDEPKQDDVDSGGEEVKAFTPISGKRERKRTVLFDARPSSSGKTRWRPMRGGSGVPLGKIPNVSYMLSNANGRDEEIIALHRILCGSAGVHIKRKADIRKFSGFLFQSEKDRQTMSTRLSREGLLLLRKIARVLDVSSVTSTTSKPQVVDALLAFLEDPKAEEGRVDLAEKAKQKKEARARKRARRSRKATGPASQATGKRGRLGKKRKASGDSEAPSESGEDYHGEEAVDTAEAEEKVRGKKKAKTNLGSMARRGRLRASGGEDGNDEKKDRDATELARTPRRPRAGARRSRNTSRISNEKGKRTSAKDGNKDESDEGYGAGGSLTVRSSREKRTEESRGNASALATTSYENPEDEDAKAGAPVKMDVEKPESVEMAEQVEDEVMAQSAPEAEEKNVAVERGAGSDVPYKDKQPENEKWSPRQPQGAPNGGSGEQVRDAGLTADMQGDGKEAVQSEGGVSDASVKDAADERNLPEQDSIEKQVERKLREREQGDHDPGGDTSAVKESRVSDGFEACGEEHAAAHDEASKHEVNIATKVGSDFK